MQFTITINQAKALEWKLNAQQALLFAFIYECPSWCRPVKTDLGVFYALSKAKVVEELPLLSDKPDTAYRLLKQLETAGVVQLSHTPSITLVRLTCKGREWNRKIDGSEKYPGEVGKISEAGRKNLRGRSEKSPTNQDTSNQDTNQEDNLASPDAGVEKAFELYWETSTKCGSRKKASSLFAAICKREKRDPMEFAAMLAADIMARLSAKQFGFEKMHGTTYLNQERWNDAMPSASADKPSVTQDFKTKTYQGTPDDQFADFLQ